MSIVSLTMVAASELGFFQALILYGESGRETDGELVIIVLYNLYKLGRSRS